MFSDHQISIHNLIDVIVTTLNVRDPYTFSHSWRVAKISELIAKNLMLENEWVERIHTAAHLHDIGKIGVPDAILNKKGKLTDEEYEIMKSHPITGYAIVCKLPILEDISLYMRHHHERIDGKGYPDGLKGKDIPMGARIIAVADTFDAITSHRHYRASRSYEEAYEEIKRCSGTQLCPESVECFLTIKEDVQNILSKINTEIINQSG